MACRVPSLDRHGRQQRIDAVRLSTSPARSLARGYGPRLIPRGRLLAGQHLGRAGVRVPQHLPGALAMFRRQHGDGFCARQDDAVSPGPARASRRHSRARARSCRKRRSYQARSRERSTVRVVDRPFPQPLGHRTAAEVWRRQLRWARLRRDTFRFYFVPEIAAGGIPPLAAGAIVAASTDWPVAGALIAFGAIWYGAEAALAFAAGWHLSWRWPFFLFFVRV